MNIHDFINLSSHQSTKPPEDIIHMAKRQNNPKRDFLFINQYLGKHLSVSAQEALLYQKQLYNKIVNHILDAKLENQKILIVGFAETATALAQNIMHFALEPNQPLTVVGYTQTTRESIQSNQYINISFEEEHSHATTQKLYFDPQLEYDIILFIEDEITTGNTILNFIKAFKKHQPNKQYIVASLLNWQNEEATQTFKDKNIATISLTRGSIKTETPSFELEAGQRKNHYHLTKFIFNPRLPLSKDAFRHYQKAIANFSKWAHLQKPKTLVIGTEENMFIPMHFAAYLHADFKATTRSPITPSMSADYPIHSQFVLNSAYNPERVTYLYNINVEEYDHYVLVLEESNPIFEKQITQLLGQYGSVTIINQKDFYYD